MTTGALKPGVRPAVLGASARLALSALLAALWFAAPSVGTRAMAQAAIKTKAKQAILIDVSANAVLFEKNADQRVPPASMSKLMTLNVIFKGLADGRLDLENEYLMSVNAWRNGGAPSRTSAMMVPVNTREPLEQLLHGIIVPSGNDAAIALAEGIAGSENAFSQLMNAEAKRIGLTGSHFANATGLPNDQHYMTVRDLAKLARHIIDTYPQYYPWFKQKRFKYRRHNHRNTNPLLWVDETVDGLKTGYLSTSGYGLTASAVRDGRRLILVVHGLPTKQDRRTEAQKLLEWGFSGFSKVALEAGAEVVGHARVWGGDKFFVPLRAKGNLTAVLPRFPANPKLKAEIVYKGPLKPPIKQGQQVATLRVATQTGAVNNIPLYAAEPVKRGGIIRQGLDSLAHLAFGWLP